MASAEASAEACTTINVQVVYGPLPGVTDLVSLTLPLGSTVAQAVQASGLLQRHTLLVADVTPGAALEALRLGVWGKPRDANSLLRERDRVEIYRPLLVDPKEARRQRYKKHRAAV
jgi:uncharacterized protein